MRVAFDLDNVVVDILHSATAEMAAATGIPVDEIGMTWNYDSPFTHADPGTAARLLPDNAFWQRENVIMNARPMPGAIDALNTLHRRGMLAGYVTRRAPETRPATLHWLRRGGAPDVPLHTVGHIDRALCHDRCKSDACLAMEATHLVDDNPHEVARVLAASVCAVLVDHPLGRAARRKWHDRNRHVVLVDDAAGAVRHLLAP